MFIFSLALLPYWSDSLNINRRPWPHPGHTTQRARKEIFKLSLLASLPAICGLPPGEPGSSAREVCRTLHLRAPGFYAIRKSFQELFCAL